ncbi:MAG: glycosyltransferase family 4 protein [Candidatus Eremiobacteraeota bacterium]|nr:glycosyltransferase family 4 protein [Candidatus Eremiobacteraeota bacterium]
MNSSRTDQERLKNNTRLLLLNWRDPWHPQAGGAELLTWRICERLADRGWDVEWFTARYATAAPDEIRRGVHFVRAGTQLTVHWEAFRRYRRGARFDCVVEEINTLPFFTPLYVPAPKAAFFCQLAREVWRFEAPRVIGSLGYTLEPFYLRPYRKLPLITISPSSAASLHELGLRGPTYVIPMAVDEAAVEQVQVEPPSLDVAVISRLTPSKRIEDCIAAAAAMIGLGWSGRLHIVGDGKASYVQALRAAAAALPGGRVVFHGRVRDTRRRAVLMNCAALWVTSVREGWGLVVTEAARCGKPSVVYDVHGLRDAVVDGVTGYIVPEDPNALAEATLKLFGGRYGDIAANALARSRALSWDTTTDAFESAVRSAIA